MWEIFAGEYLAPGRLEVIKTSSTSDQGTERIAAAIKVDGIEQVISGIGNGPIAAFCEALTAVDLGAGGLGVRVLDYHEHALTSGRDAEAAAYLEIEIGDQVLWGVGISESIVQASLRAVMSAANRVARQR